MSDPKSVLMQFCQRYTKRPVLKADIAYSCTTFGPKQIQATVTLNCLEGQEFAGECKENPKEAEQAAAQQAMVAYAEVAAQLGNASGSSKKRKGAGGAATQMLSVQDSAGGQDPMEPSAKRGKGIDEDGDNKAMTDKVKLNNLAMKLAGRTLAKGDTVYETKPVGFGKVSSGFQATVQLPCLPGEWSTAMFTGEVCQTKALAEQNAAGIALQNMSEDPELAGIVASSVPKSTKASFTGGKIGKGSGKGKSGAHMGGANMGGMADMGMGGMEMAGMDGMWQMMMMSQMMGCGGGSWGGNGGAAGGASDDMTCWDMKTKGKCPRGPNCKYCMAATSSAS